MAENKVLQSPTVSDYVCEVMSGLYMKLTGDAKTRYIKFHSGKDAVIESFGLIKAFHSLGR